MAIPSQTSSDEVIVGQEEEIPSGLSAEDIEDVPPAIEEPEQAVEA